MKTQFGKLVVLGAVLAASSTFAMADTITLGSYGSTSGYNPGTITVSNTETMYVANDLVSTVPAIPVVPALTSITAVNAWDLNPGGVWNNAFSNSSWVGSAANAGPVGTSNPQYGYYEYTSTFTAAGGVYTGNLDVYADDTMEVLLNGVVIIPFGNLGTDTHCADNAPTCLTADNDIFSGGTDITLLSGTNTLEFVVEQAGTGPQGGTGDPSGFDFAGTLSIAPTPEPNSLVLLGTGLLGAAGMLVRKRQTA